MNLKTTKKTTIRTEMELRIDMCETNLFYHDSSSDFCAGVKQNTLKFSDLNLKKFLNTHIVVNFVKK